MSSLDFSRYALTSCVAAAMLVGCGGSQPPVSTTGAMLQTSTIAARSGSGKSWMLPEAKSEDLLYASTPEYGTVYVFSYPQGKKVGTLALSDAFAECSDQKGDVWVTQVVIQRIVEYAHGGTTPIATLTLPGSARSCSIDPTTGNLMVTVPASNSNGYGGIAIYTNAQGEPTLYSDPAIAYPDYCAYDNEGNAYVYGEPATGGSQFAELPSGSGSFTNISLSKSIRGLGPIQYDGTYMTITNYGIRGKGFIYRLQISGSTSKLVSRTRLDHWNTHDFGIGAWMSKGTMVAPTSFSGKSVTIWKYPEGGKSIKIISDFLKRRVQSIYDVTVSLASGR